MSDADQTFTNENAPGNPEAPDQSPDGQKQDSGSTNSRKPSTGTWRDIVTGTWTDDDGKVRQYVIDPRTDRKVRDWNHKEIEDDRREWVRRGYDYDKVRAVDLTLWKRHADAGRDFVDAFESAQGNFSAHEREIAAAREYLADCETELDTACGAVPVDPVSPVAVANRFVRRHARHPDGPVIRRWRGNWYGWDRSRGHYIELSNEAVDANLYRALKLNARRIVGDVRHALLAVDDVLIDQAELDDWIGERPSFDADLFDLAACPNGLLHLPTGTIIPATPRYFSTSALGVAYVPDAASPARWIAFLQALWPDDKESIEALQEWFGLLLTADTRQQKILLLVGPKRSGKGTIMRVLTELLGRASVAAPTLAGLGTNFGLQPLIGKRAAIVGDARLGSRSDIAQIVERVLSISGQDPQTIDRKHRDQWTGYLSVRVTLVSNELPRFNDASGAIASRMIALQLSRSWLGKEDTHLTDALVTELPGILLWAIEGWRRLRERGHFVLPKSSQEMIEDLTDLGSPVASWVRERCELGAGCVVPVDDAYRDHVMWCGRNGHAAPSKGTFGRDLAAATSCKRTQPRIGGQQVPHYRGLQLRPAERGSIVGD